MTHIITDRQELRDVISYVKKRGEFAFDVETKGADEHGGDVRGDWRRNEVFWLSLATYGLSCTIPMGHPIGRKIGVCKEPRVDVNGKTRMFTVPEWSEPPPQLPPSTVFGEMEDLFFSETLKIGHNVKFDLSAISKYYDGQVIPPNYFCTMIAAQVLDQVTPQYRLGALTKKEFGFVYDKSLGAKVEIHSYKDAANYSRLDSAWTWQLYRRYRDKFGPLGLEGIWKMEMDILEVLLHMEKAGVLFDSAEAMKLRQELGRQLDQLQGDMYRIAGRELNIGSPQQLGELLYGKKIEGNFGLKVMKRTPTNQPSTDKAALENLVHPFLDVYRESKTTGTIQGFLQTWLGGDVSKTDDKGRVTTEYSPSKVVMDRINADFKQMGARTGRLSCGNPNMQNIPRPDEDRELSTKVRGLFIAEPGRKLIVADYGQIEYVVMAHVSRDPVLLRAFAEGVDLHLLVASMVFGIPMDEVTKSQRTTAKNCNFAVAYGSGIAKIAVMSGISQKEAERFVASHRKLLPTLYKWKEREIKLGRARGHSLTIMGRRRGLPDLTNHNDERRKAAERQLINSDIQGSAADIIKIAMIRLHRTLPNDMQLLLQVHDELVMSVPDDRVDEGLAVMEEAMLGEGIQQMLSVKMKVDICAVDNWAMAKA